MKNLLIVFACLIPFSASVNAEIKCPSSHLIEENIDKFVNTKQGTEDFSEIKITLDSREWIVESDLLTPDIKMNASKSLNKEISDIDLHTCNYLVYPADSNLEDVSIMLKAE